MGPPGSRAARVLIVAWQTADSPELMAAVSERAARGPTAFTLLLPGVPHRMADPRAYGTAAAHARLDETLPLLSTAAEQDVQGIVGASDPLTAVQDALDLLGFDEVIVSTLPVQQSRWLRLGLPAKIEALGVPVTAVTSADRAAGPNPAAA